MRCLLDSHALLWYYQADPQLGQRARNVIENKNNRITYSIVGIWELGIKVSKGKLLLDMDEFVDFYNGSGFILLSVTPKDVLKSTTLQWHHKDPFDRILVAQAMVGKYTLITKDENITKYEVKTLW